MARMNSETRESDEGGVSNSIPRRLPFPLCIPIEPMFIREKPLRFFVHFFEQLSRDFNIYDSLPQEGKHNEVCLITWELRYTSCSVNRAGVNFSFRSRSTSSANSSLLLTKQTITSPSVSRVGETDWKCSQESLIRISASGSSKN